MFKTFSFFFFENFLNLQISYNMIFYWDTVYIHYPNIDGNKLLIRTELMHLNVDCRGRELKANDKNV